MATLAGIDPRLRPYAEHLLWLGRQHDPNLVVTSGYRSERKQAELYRRYKAGLSQIPAAPPGGSLHQYGLAFDLARRNIDPLGDPLLEWLGRVWTSWGGLYGGARDPVHFQPRV